MRCNLRPFSVRKNSDRLNVMDGGNAHLWPAAVKFVWSAEYPDGMLPRCLIPFVFFSCFFVARGASKAVTIYYHVCIPSFKSLVNRKTP